MSDRPAPPQFTRAEWILFSAIALVAAMLRFDHLGVGYLNAHATRDYFRAQMMLAGVEFPVAGAEMLYGGRTVGWFLYLLLAVPLSLSPSPLGIAALINMLAVAAVAICHLGMRRFVGVSTSLVITALYAVSPLAVVTLRNMWNPAFLPIFNVVALVCLLLWRIEERRWAFAGALIAWGLAFQIHFSVYVHLIALLALRPWKRDRRPGWGPLLLAVVVLAPFFGPYLMREMATGWSNARVIAEGETGFLQAKASDMLSPEINPTFLPQALQNLRLVLHEDIQPSRIVHFTHYGNVLREEPALLRVFVEGIGWFTWIQVLLFAVGMIALLCVVTNRPRGISASLSSLFITPGAARTVAGVVLVWLGASGIMLMLLKLEGPPYERPVPPRYFTIWFPLQFIAMAIGLRAIGLLFGVRERLGIVSVSVVVALVAGQALFLAHFFHITSSTGYYSHYVGRPERPLHNMGDKLRIAEILVTQRGMNLNAFRERFTTHDLYADTFDEEFIDFEMRAQPGFTEQSDPPLGVYYHLMDQSDILPFPPDQIEVLHTDTAGALVAVTFRVLDPEIIIPGMLVENTSAW